MDEIKARYYAIARQLLIGREGGSQQVANHTLVKHPFNLQYELNRKKGMDLVMANRDITVVRLMPAWMLHRRAQFEELCVLICHIDNRASGFMTVYVCIYTVHLHQDETEMQLLQQADKIEAAKRAEAAKLRPAAAPGSAGGKGVGGAPTPSQAIELDYTEVAPAPGGVCSLFDANLKPFQPPKAGANDVFAWRLCDDSHFDNVLTNTQACTCEVHTRWRRGRRSSKSFQRRFAARSMSRRRCRN